MLRIHSHARQHSDQATIVPVQQLRLIVLRLDEAQDCGLAYDGGVEDIVWVEETSLESGDVGEDYASDYWERWEGEEWGCLLATAISPVPGISERLSAAAPSCCTYCC